MFDWQVRYLDIHLFYVYEFTGDKPQQNDNQPESEVAACDGSVAVIKAVTADRAPCSVMVDLQPTLVRRFTGFQTQSSLGIR